jgi:hypothetical protein
LVALVEAAPRISTEHRWARLCRSLLHQPDGIWEFLLIGWLSGLTQDPVEGGKIEDLGGPLGV